MQDFMQFGFSEEASELVNDFLDFGGTCMRPTGELYGISGGKCRKGSESEPAEKRSNLHMRAYIRLMKKAKERGKPADTSGYHSHHAFPSSIFTNKETADKHQVWLTHGEHFAAHHLVYQALKNRYGEKDQRTIKMGYAIARMARGGRTGIQLTKKQYEEALKVGREAQVNKYKDPKEREKQRIKAIEAQNRPEVKERQRVIQRERWAKPGEIEKLKEIINQPEKKRRLKEGLREFFANPENLKAHKAKMKEVANRKEVKERMKNNAIAQWGDPEKAKALKEAQKKGWTPEARDNFAKIQRGLKAYNDGTKVIKIKSGDPIPSGFSPGYLPKGPWATDGVNTRRLKLNEEIPTGWRIGRTMQNKGKT